MAKEVVGEEGGARAESEAQRLRNVGRCAPEIPFFCLLCRMGLDEQFGKSSGWGRTFSRARNTSTQAQR